MEPCPLSRAWAHCDMLVALVYAQRTVVLKLNGGLGTSMGLDKAKSLLTVKQNKTFLDFTALQVRIQMIFP
mgnify:CR=1 FL=1